MPSLLDTVLFYSNPVVLLAAFLRLLSDFVRNHAPFWPLNRATQRPALDECRDEQLPTDDYAGLDAGQIFRLEVRHA